MNKNDKIAEISDEVKRHLPAEHKNKKALLVKINAEIEENFNLGYNLIKNGMFEDAKIAELLWRLRDKRYGKEPIIRDALHDASCVFWNREIASRTP